MIITVSPETERLIYQLATQKGQDAAVLAGSYLELALKGENGIGEELDADYEPDALEKAMAKMRARTPEQIAEARNQLFQASKPPRPLPEGQTIFDAIGGKWPSNETDEEVFAALKKLS